MDTPYPSSTNDTARHAAVAGAAPAALPPACGSSPRTVIRGESTPNSKNRAHAALTDWLNVSFPFHPENTDPESFFNKFSEISGGAFGGMSDRERGLHGWKTSYVFDRGGVVFAFGGQRNTAFLSLPGEGCSYVSNWQPLVTLLRDELHGHITRWDGAADDFQRLHSVDHAVELYKRGGFKNGGRQPLPRQLGNWITPDDLGRTFQVGHRKNGKLLRVYEKGKHLGDPLSPWVRWEVELHAIDRTIPWDVLARPGDYVSGSYPCLSWVSELACRIRTVKAQDAITYNRLKHVSSIAYGSFINVMIQREGSAERVVELLRRDGVPRRLSFSDDFLHAHGVSGGI